MSYPSDIKPLTGLRFVAAFWLLIYFFWSRFDLGPRSDFGLIDAGGMGVDLFFILSGFVLAHVYGPQVETGTFNWVQFIWARLARVYPLHLACLAAMIVLWIAAMATGSTLQEGAFMLNQIPAHLLLVQAWGTVSSDGWNFPSWSISAEWFAYLSFPLTFAISRFFKLSPLAGVTLTLVLFYALDQLVRPFGLILTDMTYQGGALRILPSFLLGILLWQLGRRVNIGLLPSYLGLVVTFVWVLVSSQLHLPPEFIWPAMGATVFFVAETSKHPQKALMASPLWVYLGEISFAAYMVHLPIDIAFYQLIERAVGHPTGLVALGLGIVALGLTLAGAAFAHAFIEKPARDFMRSRPAFFWTRGSS